MAAPTTIGGIRKFTNARHPTPADPAVGGSNTTPDNFSLQLHNMAGCNPITVVLLEQQQLDLRAASAEVFSALKMGRPHDALEALYVYNDNATAANDLPKSNLEEQIAAHPELDPMFRDLILRKTPICTSDTVETFLNVQNVIWTADVRSSFEIVMQPFLGINDGLSSKNPVDVPQINKNNASIKDAAGGFIHDYGLDASVRVHKGLAFPGVVSVHLEFRNTSLNSAVRNVSVLNDDASAYPMIRNEKLTICHPVTVLNNTGRLLLAYQLKKTEDGGIGHGAGTFFGVIDA